MRCSPRPLCGSFLLVLLLAACSKSSGGGGGGSLGVNNPVQAYVVDKSVLAFAGVAEARLMVPVLLFPSMYAAAGITFELDTSPGAAPHTYDFVIPFDSNGNGTKDATMSGKAVLSADPLVGGQLVAGFEASTTVTLTTNGGQGVFSGDLELSFDANGEFRVSGTGTYTDATTFSSVSLAVEPAHPLHIRMASDEPDHVANACIWSVDGTAEVLAYTNKGDYNADWKFSPTTSLIQALNAYFTPPGGMSSTKLPDSQFEAAPCPGAGVLGDWAGNFTFDWFCIPPESGQSALTITVIDSNTIEIADEDPPASGKILVYQAQRDAHDPHVVHGSFEAGSGGTYEEDFTWILADDKQTFQQVSEYIFLTGPNVGTGGDCGGVAQRN